MRSSNCHKVERNMRTLFPDGKAGWWTDRKEEIWLILRHMHSHVGETLRSSTDFFIIQTPESLITITARTEAPSSKIPRNLKFQTFIYQPLEDETPEPFITARAHTARLRRTFFTRHLSLLLASQQQHWKTIRQPRQRQSKWRPGHSSMRHTDFGAPKFHLSQTEPGEFQFAPVRHTLIRICYLLFATKGHFSRTK